MATLVLSTLGAAVGGSLGPLGATLGRAAGAIAGRFIDQRLFGDAGPNREGPRLKSLDVQSSTEGASLPRVYGRVRLSGQVIWATRFEEVKSTSRSGGKGGQPSSGSTTTYSYYANFAVALCEGEIAHLGRIWADGKLLDPSLYTIRVYKGASDQLPDSLIEAYTGAGNAPAYQGVAYVVFERMALEAFGNRLPQLSFEVTRAVGELETSIKAVCVIPGATEFGYDTVRVVADLGSGNTKGENTHLNSAITDWTLSIDELLALCPNLERVGLVVSWFGTDLRASHCQFKPGVEEPAKATRPYFWQVGGVGRTAGHQISRIDGRVAFGGTPSDASVLRAIADLKARGLEVVFYPFLLMDVPSGNTLPNPYGGAGQPVYPWRGEITLSVAPGQAGSPDANAAAGAEIASLLGLAQPGQFAASSETVVYSGPSDWGYRRFILHYAKLCALAGGVDAFLVGTELRGLTQARDGRQSFPFVEALKTLAGEVAAILPDAKLTYAADWSEYASYQPQDGSGDVLFPLDRLWGDAHIDSVGIDNYLPLSDWRDGKNHLDKVLSSRVENVNYLQSGIEGGEYADWYYASWSDRQNQIRTPITDGAYNKPWIYKAKDMRAWWENAHYERLSGGEVASPTDWQPRSKPIWFTELGCPALDKGANQPNVYYDPKSSSSALPHFSNGNRNDEVQRSFLKAHIAYWSEPQNNPLSPLYSGPMIDADKLFLWAWDARPYPVFPHALSVWSDGENWQRGHWLNGRLGACPLNELIMAILADCDISLPVDVNLFGSVEGYVLDRPMSARQALSPLQELFAILASEKTGTLTFQTAEEALATLTPDQLVREGSDPLISDVRGQASELPEALSLGFADPLRDYQVASLTVKTASFDAGEVAVANLPCTLARPLAATLASQWLTRKRTNGVKRSLSLPRHDLALEAGDVVRFEAEEGQWLVSSLVEGRTRELVLERLSGSLSLGAAPDTSPYEPQIRVEPGGVIAEFLDLPLLDETRDEPQIYVAAYAKPWPGSLTLYQEQGEALSQLATVSTPATMGKTIADLPSGPVWRFDRSNSLEVELYDGVLSSVTEAELLAGANAAALKTPSGQWEIIQFATAELIGSRHYRLSTLLRGQKGTEEDMAELLPSGQPFVLLDPDVASVPLILDQFNTEISFRLGPSDRSFDHDSYQSFTSLWQGRGLKPFSPVHVQACRKPEGVEISFIRRTRLGGDSWSFEEQPLGEPSETYVLEVLDRQGGSLASYSLSAPFKLYQDELAHFGSLQTELQLKISQISARVGAGVPFTGTVSIL